MGGRRLTPSEAVDALGEAIEIIRGVWDGGDGNELRFDGDYYRLNGAQRGPMPTHDIPIWVGAYKPWMLRLTGQKADGWLPSIGHMYRRECRRSWIEITVWFPRSLGQQCRSHYLESDGDHCPGGAIHRKHRSLPDGKV